MPRPRERYVDIHDISDRIGWSTKTIRRKVKSKEFPAPFSFSGRWTWLESEIDLWMYRTAIANAIDPDTLSDDGTCLDNRGQSGTSHPGDGNPPSGRKK